MILRFLPLIALCAAAGETPETTTGGAEAPPAPAPETPENPPAPEAKKSGINQTFAGAKNLLAGLTTNGAQLVALRGDLAARDATIADLTRQLAERDATIAAQLEELTQFRTETTGLQALVSKLQAEKKDVDTEVIHQLATAGMPETALPKPAAGNAPGETYSDLVAAAEAEADPRKKGDLMNRAFAVQAKELARKEAAMHSPN